ncbi:MAG: hypothetical protein WC236_02005 [Gallionellaceae bacterium]|jgi:hypothetical protein
MKKIVLLSLSIFLLSGCASLKSWFGGVSNEAYIKIDDVKYRAGNASGALIGSVGYASGLGLFGGANTFDRKKIPDYGSLKLTYEGVIDQAKIENYAVEAKAEVEGEIVKKVEANASAEGRVATESEKQVTYHLISITSSDDLIVELNLSKNSRSFDLMKAGKTSSRIVTKILVAYGYKLSETIKASGSAGLSLASASNLANLVVGGAASADTKNKVSLSDGMIVGYSYDILCWRRNASDKVEILTSVLDQYGASQKCPSGSQQAPDKI